jgi:hypothetical protein
MWVKLPLICRSVVREYISYKINERDVILLLSMYLTHKKVATFARFLPSFALSLLARWNSSRND